jgi:hypothetical protein
MIVQHSNNLATLCHFGVPSVDLLKDDQPAGFEPNFYQNDFQHA